MIRIEEICDKVRRNHPQADLNLLRRAYLFSAREHRGQKRASGESYLVHPLEVANILATCGSMPYLCQPVCFTTWLKTRWPTPALSVNTSAKRLRTWLRASPRLRI